MGNRLPDGLGGCSHWVDMLGGVLSRGQSNRGGAGPLPTGELLKIAIEVADALEKAHRARIIHRDLKPGNVMLTKSGAMPVESAGAPKQDHEAVFLQNFFDELRRCVPAGK
jgi:serine/threonine protein kinase